MSTLTNVRRAVQADDAALAAAWDPDRPAVEPMKPACQGLADWIAGQASLFRSPARRDDRPLTEGERVLDLVAAALQELAAGLAFHDCRTPAEYAAFGPLRVPGGDLDMVVVPHHRANGLAGALDGEAVAYLALDTECGRLCAAAILALADEAQRLGAEDARDYARRSDLAHVWDLR